MADAKITKPKYWYVSYTKPDLSDPVERLIV
jgi:hypothetical protein